MMKIFFHFLLPCLLISAAAACDRCVHQSKTTFFGETSTISSGACGYKDQAWLLSQQGYVALGVPKLFREGAGCGACYKVRCKNQALCTTSGVTVVLTDSQGDEQTDLVLSPQAFSAMTKTGMARDLASLGPVDMEYKRVPCVYNSPNLGIRVEQESSKPYYLAVKFMYQGGQTDIFSVEVAPVGSSSWTSLTRRSYSTVWTSNQFLQGPLQLRVGVISGNSRAFYYNNKAVLPVDWKNGFIYDTSIQIKDIAQERCYPCDNSSWY